METIRADIKLRGDAAMPSGAWEFDGRNNDPTDLSTGSPFPPAPYPGATVENTKFLIRVQGVPLAARLFEIRVTVYWDGAEGVGLKTRIHP